MFRGGQHGQPAAVDEPNGSAGEPGRHMLLHCPHAGRSSALTARVFNGIAGRTADWARAFGDASGESRACLRSPYNRVGRDIGIIGTLLARQPRNNKKNKTSRTHHIRNQRAYLTRQDWTRKTLKYQ